MESATPTKVMIWAKTYPELSSRHRETVCTGGCLEDGTPIRLYPVPLRYLPHTEQYRLYDWIEVPLRRNPLDTRPESFRVARGTTPRVLHWVGRENGWEARSEIIDRKRDWHYGCLDELRIAQQTHGTSLGVLRVRQVDAVEVVGRSDDDRRMHELKLRALKSGLDLFSPGSDVQKDLEFLPWRFRLKWRCDEDRCKGHSASVLDWGLGELAQRDGPDIAQRRLEDISNLSVHDLRLFMGNIKSRQHIFSIVGLWYPQIVKQAQTSLFTP
jgi:hypothetical protein